MDAIGDATDRYTVYVPEELFHLTVPSNAGLIDFVKAAWKKRPLLKCINAVLLKCTDLPLEPSQSLEGRVLDFTVANWMDARMDTSGSLREYFPTGPASQTASVIDVVITSNHYLTNSLTLPLSPRIDMEHPFSRSGWKREEDPSWQAFYGYWSTQNFDDVFNRDVIPLACNSLGLEHVEHRLSRLLGTSGQILVRQSYRHIFTEACDLQSWFPGRGVLVNGQPGTGKTTWLWFALVCLMAKGKSVVCFIDGETRLFHGGCVYAQKSEYSQVPNVESLWILIDVDNSCGLPPECLVGGDVWGFRIQTCSPFEKPCGTWVEANWPAVYGMPLWGEAEIIEGFRLRSEYPPLLERLGSAFESRDRDGLADMDGFLHDIVVEAWPDAEEANLYGDPEEWAEGVVNTLLSRLVELYGEIPGEVYSAISGPIYSAQDIEHSLGAIDLSELVRYLRPFRCPTWSIAPLSVPYSPFILSVSEQIADSSTLIPKFRSDTIGRRFIQRFGNIPVEHVSTCLVGVYQRSSPSSLLSKWIFDSYAHAVLSGPLHWLMFLRVMGDAAKARTYRLSDQPASPDTMPFRGRQVVTIETDNDNFVWPPNLGRTLALEDCFFVLKQREDALFDSFYVEFTRFSSTPTVWIIRAVTDELHRGTSADYSLILSIKAKAERRADERDANPALEENPPGAGQGRKRRMLSELSSPWPTVAQIKYVLACPLPERDHTWEMPPDRPRSLKGKVYCCFIDVSSD